jgi:hypothetical protein
LKRRKKIILKNNIVLENKNETKTKTERGRGDVAGKWGQQKKEKKKEQKTTFMSRWRSSAE